MPPTDGDSNAPVAALSLLSLAASSSTSQPRSVPRAAPTTSISRSSQQPPPAPATTALTAPPPVGSASTPISPPLSSTSPTFTNAAIRVVPAHNARGMTASATQPKARRLSSASQTKRRLSEATAATIQASAADDLIRGTSVVSNSGLTAAAASLSLSTSPPTTTPPVRSVQQLIQKQSSDASGDGNDEDSAPNAGGSGRKKGVIYRCETCSKVGELSLDRMNQGWCRLTHFPSDGCRDFVPYYASRGHRWDRNVFARRPGALAVLLIWWLARRAVHQAPSVRCKRLEFDGDQGQRRQRPVGIQHASEAGGLERRGLRTVGLGARPVQGRLGNVSSHNINPVVQA
ncbi:hypothetical protein FRC00_013445 [Tulasnella sp. 408]|nr:hypothetical protein FRC00_013445 [Tulasnella sp. 408]